MNRTRTPHRHAPNPSNRNSPRNREMQSDLLTPSSASGIATRCMEIDEAKFSQDVRYRFTGDRFVPFFAKYWDEVYVPDALLTEWGVRRRKLDFYTGELEEKIAGDELFLVPMKLKDVETQMELYQPWKCRDDFGRPGDETDVSPGQPHSFHEGAVILNYLSVMLEVHGDGIHDGALYNTTNWRHGTYESNYTEKMSTKRSCMAWRLHFTYDQKERDFELDLTKPHVLCFVPSEHPIKDEKIALSEFSVILWLAMTRGGKRYGHHRRIPITIFSTFSRTIRIVQAIVNLRTLEMELRVTKSVDFMEGAVANQEDFNALLGWGLGTPTGDTEKD